MRAQAPSIAVVRSVVPTLAQRIEVLLNLCLGLNGIGIGKKLAA
jgi:hypothetical protein